MNKKKISALILSSTIIANVAHSVEIAQAATNTDNSTQGQSTSSTPTLNGIKVSKQLIDINYSKGVTTVPRYIVIHDTDNRKFGANAQANRDYFANHPDARASAHYTVDQNNIIQVLENNWRGWHVGDKSNPIINNSNTIGIELCVNVDNDFNKTLENGIALTKYLMEKYAIPAQNVVRHYDVTGKICPKYMIWDKPQLWDYLKSAIGNGNTSTSTDEKVTATGEVYNVSSSVNLRKSPSTSSEVLTSLKLGQKVDIFKEENGWYKVRAKVTSNSYNYDVIGYVYKEYIKSSSFEEENPNNNTPSTGNKKGKVINISSILNVRGGASTSDNVIGSLRNGDEVEIKNSLTGWYEINYNGKSGYVSNSYIQIIDNSTTPTEPEKEPEVEKTIVDLIKDRHNIIGTSEVTKEQFKQFLKNKSISYKLNSTIEEFVDIAYEESAIEGVRADIVIAQSLHETGYFQYGGIVKPEDNNFSGLGATGNGDERNTFSSVRIGIRAQIQHLKAYATSDALKQEVVDTRYKYVTKGSAQTLEELSGKWAVPGYDKTKYASLEAAVNANATYGQVIYKLIQDAKKEVVTTKPDTPTNPTTPDTPTNPTNPETPAVKQTGKVVNVSTNLRVRSGAGTNYGVVGYILNGETVTIEEKNGTWYKITSSKGIQGYVSGEYISIDGNSGNSNNGNNSGNGGQTPTPTSYKAKVKNITSYLNVRSGAGTNNGVIGSLKNGQEVEVTGEAGDWFKIKFSQNGAIKEGFVSSQYVEKITSNTSNNSQTEKSGQVINVTSNLNVRQGAGNNTYVVGYLLNNQKVQVISTEGNWYKIKYSTSTGTKEGYVSKDYIKIL
jgi:probable enterotoxin D